MRVDLRRTHIAVAEQFPRISPRSAATSAVRVAIVDQLLEHLAEIVVVVSLFSRTAVEHASRLRR
ncbi:MAG: hypothetical protein H0W40_10120 [Methylibium sp.]|uniref:hypothetical protein n=1 Tax=Methylibium sp. TaxID=2067992 RepID=UPI00182BC544|nr:hypothetical protein [Methylibium sp.]MBA3597719.1 hypothetical protein [Methylibium sp.]